MSLKLKHSIALDKFIKSQKSLSYPKPKLFPTNLNEPQVSSTNHAYQIPFLDLNHPVLQKLEHSCNNIKHFNQVQAQLHVLGLFQHPLAAGRCLKKLMNRIGECVLMYDCIKEPDAFMCNTVMRGFVNCGDPAGALRFYRERMIGRGVLPNYYTFNLVGKVCGDVGCLAEGKKAHALVAKFGFELDLFVRNSFIHMYSVCGRTSDSRVLFDRAYLLDLVSWNSMIDGYVKNGEVGLARELFDEMPERDVFSWNSMISGYAGCGDMEMAKVLFDGMAYKDVVTWNYIIDGYAQIGDTLMAREFFDKMPSRNVNSWNIILALCLRSKDYGECFKLFHRMVEERDIRPNEASLVSVLSACGHCRNLDLGKLVHAYIEDNKIKLDMLLLTALLNMYAKCGVLDYARALFDEMPEKSVVTWNSMIMGYGMHGHCEKAVEIFLDMNKSGPTPNAATFVCILSACASAEMVLEGWWLFDLMCRRFGIEPKEEHFGCMVELLRRLDLAEQLKELNTELNFKEEPALWDILVSAFRNHLNLELGKIVAKHLISLNSQDIAPYVMLANYWAAEGKWDEMESVRKAMKVNRLESLESSGAIQIKVCEPDCDLRNNRVHRRSIIYSLLGEMGTWMKLFCTD